MAEKQIDPAAYGAQKKEERERYYTRVQSLMEQLARDPERFRLYLQVQSRFPSYSVGNALMIAAQFPSARQIRLSQEWADMGVKPLRGVHGIEILVPGKQYTRPDGSIGRGFDVKKAFDISQTTAGVDARRPPRPTERTLLRTLLDYQKGGWSYQLIDEGENARYDPQSNTVCILQRQPLEKVYPILAREILCADLLMQQGLQRENAEPTAVCVAWMLCARYDIPPTGLTLPAPETVLGADPGKYRQALQKLTSELRPVVNFAEKVISKEREASLV